MSSAGTDPFDLLGVEPRFDLEKADIEGRQRELSKVLHPDRFSNAPAGERRAALGKAMSVNEAARLLKDPVQRGHALLARLERDGAAMAPHGDVRVSPNLLMEVMDWREELAGALTRQDKATVERIAQVARERRAVLLSQLREGFEQLSNQSGAASLVQTVAQGLAALKYLERLSEEVRRIEDEFSDASV